MCASRFHFHAHLGSTGISRFFATMRALTPDPLLQHRLRYPWFTSVHFQTFRLQPPHAPLLRRCFCIPGRPGPRFALSAIGGSFLFAPPSPRPPPPLGPSRSRRPPRPLP